MQIEEVEKALEHIKETHEKYGQLVAVLKDATAATAKCAIPLRKSGGLFLRCAGESYSRCTDSTHLDQSAEQEYPTK